MVGTPHMSCASVGESHCTQAVETADCPEHDSCGISPSAEHNHGGQPSWRIETHK